MKKGGYKIIDFKGTALSGTAVELSGVYDQIIDDYGKAILVSGVSLNGELQDDAYASVKVNEGSVDLTVYGGIITVTEDDEVSFVVSKTTAELTAEIGDLDDLDTTDKDSLVDAINEVKGDSESVIKILAFKHSTNVSVAANSAESIVIDTFECPTGYKPIAVLTASCGSSELTISAFGVSDTAADVRAFNNNTSSAVNAKPSMTVAFIKESFVESST